MTLLELLDSVAKSQGVPVQLMKSIILQESLRAANATGKDPFSIKSKAGATGLAQLMPTTAKGLGVTNSSDPVQSIVGMGKLLAELNNTYKGNIPLMLAAYNAGPKAVARAGNRVPAYKETQDYVRTVMADFESMQGGGRAGQHELIDRYLGVVPNTQQSPTKPLNYSPAPVPPVQPQAAANVTPAPSFQTTSTPQPVAPTIIPAEAPNVVDYTSQLQTIQNKLNNVPVPTLQTTAPINANALSQSYLQDALDNVIKNSSASPVDTSRAAQANLAVESAMNKYGTQLAQGAASLAAVDNSVNYRAAADKIATALNNQQNAGANAIRAAEQEVRTNDARIMDTTSQIYNQNNFNPLNINSEWNQSVADQRALLNTQRATIAGERDMQQATMLSDPALWLERMMLGNTYSQGRKEVDSQITSLDSAIKAVTGQLGDQTKVAIQSSVPRNNVLAATLSETLNNMNLGTKAVEVTAKAPLDQAAADRAAILSQLQIAGNAAQVPASIAQAATNNVELALKAQEIANSQTMMPIKAAADIAQYATSVTNATNSTNAAAIQQYELARKTLEGQASGVQAVAAAQNQNLAAVTASQNIQQNANQLTVQNATMQSSVEATLTQNTANKVKAEVEISSANITKQAQNIVGTDAAVNKVVSDFNSEISKAATAKARQAAEDSLYELDTKAKINKLSTEIRNSAMVEEVGQIQGREIIEANDEKIAQRARFKMALTLIGGSGAVPTNLDAETAQVLDSSSQNAGFNGKGNIDPAKVKQVMLGNNSFVAITTLNKLGLNNSDNTKYPAIANASADLAEIVKTIAKIDASTDPKEADKALKAVSQNDVKIALSKEGSKARDVSTSVPKSTKVYGFLPSAAVSVYAPTQATKDIIQQTSAKLDAAETYANKMVVIIDAMKGRPPIEVNNTIADYFKSVVAANNSLRGYRILGVPDQTNIMVTVPSITSDSLKFDVTSVVDVARFRRLSTSERMNAQGVWGLQGWGITNKDIKPLMEEP